MKIVRVVLKYLMAVFYVGAGMNHFLNPDFYMKIMPNYLPWHLELVFLSGIIEVALGAFLLLPRYTRLVAWGIIALLVAVFPANIHVALNPHVLPDVSPTFHWIRLPLQGVLIAWAYWYTREPQVES